MTTSAIRPHHAVWPTRLPRTLTLPETSLWFNLEVSARRYPHKPACVFFGQPLRFADLLAQAEALAGWLQAQGVQKGDRVAVFMQNCPQFGALWGCSTSESVSLGAVPMFHITGFVYGCLGPVAGGSTTVIMPRWDRELAGRLIARHQVTHWTCIPTMIIDLFGSPNHASFDLRSLKYLAGGGAAMPQAVAQRLVDEFNITFAEGYGLTETAAPTHSNLPERAKQQCLGMPVIGTDSRIIDPDTLAELPIGETGEIVSSGPQVFKGYWGHPSATQAAFLQLDGKTFFRTGDLGRMDEEGYFFITDRLKRMINASGFKVWPSEVELMLFKCPLVQEACVISSRDAYRGETVKAVVVLRTEARGTARPEDIIAWARQHMAAYKVPRIVEFADALPKSGSGKVMWRLLQEQQATA